MTDVTCRRCMREWSDLSGEAWCTCGVRLSVPARSGPSDGQQLEHVPNREPSRQRGWVRGRDSKKVPTPPEWGPHDDALWYTCEIAADLVAGRPPRRVPDVLASFPPPPPDSQYWASGQFQLLEYRAVGDGSYIQEEGFFFAGGPVSLAVSACVMAAQALGNSARRRAAAAAAVPRWTPTYWGDIHVAPSTFTLHTSHGLSHWRYGCIEAAQMVGPGHVHVQGVSENGPISWVLVTNWAELLFITWALREHPRHPQLLGGGWLVPDWLQRCTAHGRRPRLASPILAPS